MVLTGLSYLWPSKVLIFGIIFPFIDLIFIPLVHNLKYLNLGSQLIALVPALILLFRKKTDRLNIDLTRILAILAFLICYGVIISLNKIPLIVKLLEARLLLFPLVVAVASYLGNRFLKQFILTLFVVEIANSLAGFLELKIGTPKLLSAGLTYGSTITNFTTGQLRAPGLTLSNFDFSVLSGLVIFLSGTMILFPGVFNFTIKRNLLYIIFLLSVAGIITSATRSGAVFAVIGLAYLVFNNSKRKYLAFVGIWATIILFIGFQKIAPQYFNLTSVNSRLTLWNSLMHSYPWILGNGLGFAGSVTQSSFASPGSRLTADNYYLNILLQFGVLGVILLLVLVGYLYRKTSRIGRALVFSFALTSIFTESWEYSSFMASVMIFVLHSSKFTPENSRFVADLVDGSQLEKRY